MSADIDERLEAASTIMADAGALALDYFRRRDELKIEQKGHQDLVSIADKDVERLIRERLVRAFPDDAIIGEEEGGEEQQSAWVIDPIDGTQNFLLGLPYWTCVIAYVRDRETVIGVTVDPLHDETYVASRGGGAWRNGVLMRCDDAATAEESVVALSFSFKHEIEPFFAAMRRLADEGIGIRRLGSTALKLAHVADGRLHGMYAVKCNSWDCIAGLLTVREAGGVATDFVHRYGLIQPGGIVAGTKTLAGLLGEVSGLPPE
ncbi:MAG: inositol monophosphatase family protein [Geminicoccaceae bacterium]